MQCAKKAKADRVVVLCKSIVSGHGRLKARSRLGEKLEFLDLDPIVGEICLFPRILRYKTMDEKLINIPNDDEQIISSVH